MNGKVDERMQRISRSAVHTNARQRAARAPFRTILYNSHLWNVVALPCCCIFGLLFEPDVNRLRQSTFLLGLPFETVKSYNSSHFLLAFRAWGLL